VKASDAAVAVGTLLIAFSPQLVAQQAIASAKPIEEVTAQAQAGDAQFQYELGRRYYIGKDVPKDFAQAVKWFQKATEQNNAKAEYALGICLLNGKGVAKDEAQAVRWFRKAAEQNFASAQGQLGACYLSGQGVEKDEVEAAKWFRKAADQNDGKAQGSVGFCYANGKGVAKDEGEALKWFRKAAEQGIPQAQRDVGVCYFYGQGVAKDETEAMKWFRRASEQGLSGAQFTLGMGYFDGKGVPKDEVKAVKWLTKAAEQGDANAQANLGVCYAHGQGVAKDEVEAYKWWLLAAAKGNEDAKKNVAILENRMTREQIAEGQKLARNFKPRKLPSVGDDISSTGIAQSRPEASGTGFFITQDGYLITNEHVVEDAAQLRLVTAAGIISAKVMKVDTANDLALLKAEGKFAALPVATSRTVKLGGTVATIGFPNIGFQGFAPKFARGEIGSLSGLEDDARYFQISVPVQPGNSGGALVDEHGNVVGVVSGKLSAKATLLMSGALPENVNYAVKSSFLLSFLESTPDVIAKLKEPNTKDVKFEDVIEQAKQAAALVLVY
jgi:TPR repeat protein